MCAPGLGVFIPWLGVNGTAQCAQLSGLWQHQMVAKHGDLPPWPHHCPTCGALAAVQCAPWAAPGRRPPAHSIGPRMPRAEVVRGSAGPSGASCQGHRQLFLNGRVAPCQASGGSSVAYDAACGQMLTSPARVETPPPPRARRRPGAPRRTSHVAAGPWHRALFAALSTAKRRHCENIYHR